jgi:lysophospholipase L1-like esterase
MLKRLNLSYATHGLIMLALLLSGCEPAPRLTPLAADATILAFGDSLTFGTGGDKDQSYPAQLARLTGLRVINAGVPGEISAAGLRRLPQLLRQYQPQLLILCHGGNDILRGMPLADTRQNLQAMIDLARAARIEVVIIGVPQFGLFPSTADIYPEVAAANQIPGEETILAEILRQPALRSDHIHPNAAGYARLAAAVARLLATAGAISPQP